MKKRTVLSLLLIALIFSHRSSALTAIQLDALEAELIGNNADRSAAATAGYAQLIGFISDPVISGYTLDINNQLGSSIDIIKVPFGYELSSLRDTRIFFRGGFNYAAVDSSNVLEGFSTDKVEPTSKAYSGLIGLLFSTPLNNDWSLTPAIDIGIARIENDIEFRGADAIQAQPIVNRNVINWSSTAAIISGVLGINYQHSFSTYSLNFKGNYTHTLISSFVESGSFTGFTEQTDRLNFSAGFTWPLSIDLFGNPLFGIVHAGSTTFLGDNRNALGFSNINSIGFRVKSKTDLGEEKSKIEALTLGFDYLIGNNVNGYEIVFGLDF